MSGQEIEYEEESWFDEPVDPQLLAEAIKELRERCDKAGISVKETEGLEEHEIAFELSFSCGRNKRTQTLWDYDDIKSLLAVPFEKYTFIDGYRAISSYSDNTIEAQIKPIGPFPPRSIIRRLFGDRIDEDDLRAEKYGIELVPDEGGGPKVSIGPATPEFRAISRGPSFGNLSLKLSNSGISQHDQARSLLEKISNSIFFQIELLSGIPLGLSRERQYPKPIRGKNQRASIEGLQYPKNEYDEAPISLYWYGTSAMGMPLLQFLAFYQVIEFYFPTYFQAEARRKIRAILKNPTFRNDRDADLGKILSAIQLGRAGSLGDERSQLRATIAECVDPDSLRSFFSDSEERASFFSSKTKGITDHKIPLANSSLDLRNDVADRIYDIRCKIVHTKSDSRNGEIELLLPFSKEAEQLHYDIELVQYIAQNVLISASAPL